MDPRVLVAAAAIPFVLTACGGDDGGSSADDASSPTETLSADQAAVKDVLVQSLLDPDCSLLTEDYLVKISFFGDATPEEACQQRQDGWVEPQFDEDDIVVSEINVAGDKATAVVGSELTNITTTYELTLVDGKWLVSCDDFSCDGLPSPSAEVS